MAGKRQRREATRFYDFRLCLFALPFLFAFSLAVGRWLMHLGLRGACHTGGKFLALSACCILRHQKIARLLRPWLCLFLVLCSSPCSSSAVTSESTMVSQTLPTQTLSPPVPSFPICGSLSLKNADNDDNVCGWLINRATLESKRLFILVVNQLISSVPPFVRTV